MAFKKPAIVRHPLFPPCTLLIASGAVAVRPTADARAAFN